MPTEPLLRATRIVLHCSDTEDGPSNSWPAIRRYHMQVNGWSDIGYNYGLELIAETYVLQPGRPPWVNGAHCRAAGRNSDSLGLCVVGKFDVNPPPPRLVTLTASVLAFLCFAHGIKPEMVSGHREWEKAKTCPGAQWDLDRLRKSVDQRLHRMASAGVTTLHLVADGISL